MTLTIGRCTLPQDPKSVDMSGDQVTFGFHLIPTVASDDDHLHALRQQLLGLVDNEDEEVVPVTWSQDATFDGFYRVTSVNVPTSDILIRDAIVLDCSITLERLTGYANPTFEVTVQSVVRTNGHGITAPVGIVATLLVSSDDYDYDYGASITGSPSATRITVDSPGSLGVAKQAAPLSLTAYTYSTKASEFLVGGCRVEAKYGSTWYPVIGRNIPAGLLWRISNGYVRLTSAATNSTDGTFEVWDSVAQAWESRDVAHWTNASHGPGIGLPAASTVTVSVMRNSPEHVVVKATAPAGISFYYSLQRGHGQVSFSWTARTATKYGAGLGTAHVAAATAFTGGVRVTSNDANGNRMVFGTAAANTNDTTNGATWYTTAATSGSAWWGVDLGGSGATPATDLRDEFLGATSWRQRVIVR